MSYADYDFYVSEYKGKAISAYDFDALAQKASAYIDYATMRRAKTTAGEARYAVQCATCALADVLDDGEKLNASAYSAEQPLASETVGSWSRSYGSKSTSTVDLQLLENRKREAVAMYLAPFGLLKARGAVPCPHFPTL